MKPVDIDAIYKILKREVEHYHVPVVDLVKIQTNDPFKILVATILSARTNDATTAAACKKLFGKVNTPKDLERLDKKTIERLIFPVGFYHTKAKHLKMLPHALKEKFNGIIPSTVEELLELPGVGRKTANLVVAIAFDKPAICVDVHVHRITNRLGYLKTKNPFETEMALRKKLPKKYWTTFNSILVAFGQHLCRPTSPKCSICPIKAHCNRIGVRSSR
jgi:endonuclease III